MSLACDDIRLDGEIEEFSQGFFYFKFFIFIFFYIKGGHFGNIKMSMGVEFELLGMRD